MRKRAPEQMDQQGLDPGAHIAALNGLRRLNLVCRSAAILWPSIAEAARQQGNQPLRVLDLACGSADNILEIGCFAHRAGLNVEVFGCDLSSVAIAEARRAAKSKRIDPKNFFKLDVLAEALPDGFDVVTCSLFLHHLSEHDAQGLLRKMAAATRQLVLISDLRRTWLGLGLAWAGSRLLTRSSVVHTDAVLSVSAAFVEAEVANLAAQCGLDGCTISQHWPQRWLLWWSKQ
jgi:2-polyprenyl-3-methyl-5-hydroxy-6-metoxy-1,4-benzoquinol methylase